MSNRLLARSPGTRYAPTTTYDILKTPGGEPLYFGWLAGGDPISVMTSEKDGGRAWMLQAKKTSGGIHAHEFGNPLKAKQISGKLVVDEWQQ